MCVAASLVWTQKESSRFQALRGGRGDRGTEQSARPPLLSPSGLQALSSAQGHLPQSAGAHRPAAEQLRFTASRAAPQGGGRRGRGSPSSGRGAGPLPACSLPARAPPRPRARGQSGPGSRLRPQGGRAAALRLRGEAERCAPRQVRRAARVGVAGRLGDAFGLGARRARRAGARASAAQARPRRLLPRSAGPRGEPAVAARSLGKGLPRKAKDC